MAAAGKRVTSSNVSFYNDTVYANIFVRRVKNSSEIKTHFVDEMEIKASLLKQYIILN